MSIYCAEVLAQANDLAPERPSGPRSDVPGSETMGDVKVLLIAQRPDGFILQRFNDGGTLVGDTRHDEMDEAMRQAYSEYGSISDWHLCPDGADPLEYIRAVS